MRVDALLHRAVFAVALTGTTALAFEPGREQVCEASADGTRFECHERQGDDISARKPVTAPRPNADEPATVKADDAAPARAARATPAAPAPSAPAGGTRALPNYLLQDRSSTRADPAQTTPEPKPVRTVTPGTPAIPATPAAAPGAAPPAATPRRDAEPVVRRDETTRSAASPARADAPAPVSKTTAAAEPASSATLSASRASGAAEFRRLAALRYTLEIARADRASAFDALLATVGDVGGAFYVLALRNPTGTSYSLVWSDFASIEDARAARARLPADVAITSGWPRRIGPLQAELGP